MVRCITKQRQSGKVEPGSPTPMPYKPPLPRRHFACQPARTLMWPRPTGEEGYACLRQIIRQKQKRPRAAEAFNCLPTDAAYFSEVLIVLKFVLSLVPR